MAMHSVSNQIHLRFAMFDELQSIMERKMSGFILRERS